MNILFDIGHPGHVHLLKNVYHQLKKNGHNLWVTTKNIPIAKLLLDKYNIKYIDLGKKSDSLIGKAILQIDYNFKVLRIVKKYNIEIGVGSSITLAHVSKLTKMKSILLDDDDDEVQPFFVKYGHPFADTILSPESLINHRSSKKAIYYSGFHELAYLHPNRFKPDIQVIKDLGMDESDIYFVIRFLAFKGHHDVGHKGINLNQKRAIIKLLEAYGRIFITSEREIESEFEKYRLGVPPEKMHSLLYYSTMFLGDSQTMTSEAAILGTPALKCNTFARLLSVPNELEDKYGLCFSFLPVDFENLITKAKELLNTEGLKEDWKKRKSVLLNDKIDVTKYMVWFIENYPKSVSIMKENPDYQNRF